MRSKARKLLHALEGDCECNSHLVLLFEERHSSDLVPAKFDFSCAGEERKTKSARVSRQNVSNTSVEHCNARHLHFSQKPR